MKTTPLVLICGSGPVGLLLAISLVSKGVKNVRIIDKTDGPCSDSRVVGLHARTLETLELCDVAGIGTLAHYLHYTKSISPGLKLL